MCIEEAEKLKPVSVAPWLKKIQCHRFFFLGYSACSDQIGVWAGTDGGGRLKQAQSTESCC